VRRPLSAISAPILEKKATYFNINLRTLHRRG